MPPDASTYQLAPEQLQSFRENGYLVIRGLISQPAVESYRQRFIDFCDGKIHRSQMIVVKDYALSKSGAKPEHYINKVQELLHDEVFSTYSEDPRLLHILAQLIGDDITAVHCMLINKPPGTSQHPPHQDLIYLPIGPADKILVAWTAIDPVSKENGGLYMVPGTHTLPVLEHTEASNDTKDFYQGVVNWEAIAAEKRRVYLPMSPGDTVLFNPGIVHGSLPNTSGVCRKAMTCIYASSGCNYLQVEGSKFERVARMMENKLRERNSEFSYIDMWRLKSKQVRGVRCNL